MKIAKIGLSIMLFLCLIDMPYGYYQLVRFICFVFFAIFAIEANQSSNQTDTIIFTSLAILFQPFLKIALGRELWNIVDVLVGIYILATINNNNNEK
jgi:hypothetical protein